MKYIIGNLKMNFSYDEAKNYFEELKKDSTTSANYVGVCVPSIYLELAVNIFKNSNVAVGAQNIFYENSGAYTGEISVPMIKSMGCQLALVGHSERRAKFGETNEDVNKKMQACFNAAITPILCVGETLAEREDGKTLVVIEEQLSAALKEIKDLSQKTFFIAYEPVWAIGTGVSATTQDAKSVISHIKQFMISNFGENNSLQVLYGGSLTASNAKDILNGPEIDGGLVGGASLKVESFNGIYNFNQT